MPVKEPIDVPLREPRECRRRRGQRSMCRRPPENRTIRRRTRSRYRFRRVLIKLSEIDVLPADFFRIGILTDGMHL